MLYTRLPVGAKYGNRLPHFPDRNKLTGDLHSNQGEDAYTQELWQTIGTSNPRVCARNADTATVIGLAEGAARNANTDRYEARARQLLMG